MAVYIAFLRGINVGGKNTVKMAELKKVFESLGFGSVQTYIQSGNVLFESDDGEKALHGRIEAGISSAFGFTVPIVLRTAAQLEQAVQNCPYSQEERDAANSPDFETFYIAFFQTMPAPESITKLNAYKNEADDFIMAGRDAYLLMKQSIRTSKIADRMQKLNVYVTIRNLKTISALLVLAKA